MLQLLIDPSKFNFTATDEDRLGSGGAGEVFRGTYADEPVAVKIFHSTRSARYWTVNWLMRSLGGHLHEPGLAVYPCSSWPGLAAMGGGFTQCCSVCSDEELLLDTLGGTA